jgi:hypothetical protein
VLVTPILVAAGVILFVFPHHTEDLWAWPINPPLTAMAVGGGYLAGSVFFARAAWHRRWHMMAHGFPAATVLTVLLLAATLLHWDRFTHGHVSFWAWLAVYLVTPLLLPTVWYLNRRHDPGAVVSDGLVPRSIGMLVGALGATQLVIAVAFFVHPPLAERLWPWTLSPLTARTISAFLAFIAVLLLTLSFERRWSALRLLVDSAALGLALVAVGVLRSYDDLTGGPAANATFLVILIGVVVALVAVRFTVRRPESAAYTFSRTRET